MQLVQQRQTAIIGAAALGTATVLAVHPLGAEPASLTNFHLTSSDTADGLQGVFDTASANVTDIWNHASIAPFPVLQQILANQVGYVENAFTDPSSISAIPGEISDNIQAAGQAPFVPFEPTAPGLYSSLDNTPLTLDAHSGLLTSNPAIEQLLQSAGLLNSDGSLTLATLPGHEGMIDALTQGVPLDSSLNNILNTSVLGLPSLADDINQTYPGLLSDGNVNIINLLIPDEQLRNTIEPLLAFTGSPLSGVLWGMAGTAISPMLALEQDFTSFSGDLQSGDVTAAFQDVFSAPTNVLNAFLNGYGDVDLNSVLSLFGAAMPADLNIDPTLDLGGLLSGGGSFFDAIGLTADLGDCSVLCATADLPGLSVGPIASLVELVEAVASSLGWDGTGMPLDNLFDIGTLF